MARRSPKAQNQTPVTETDSTTNPDTVQEDTVSTETTTQPEVTETEAPAPEVTEAEAPATEAKAPEAEADLTAFQAAATEAVESADESTGDVPEAGIAKLNAEYRKVAGLKGKNAARTFLNTKMKDAMDESDIVKARAYMNLGEHLSAGSSGGGGAKVERTPVDPTEAYVDRVVTLKLATQLVPLPEGLSEDWSDKANAKFGEVEAPAREYLTWLEADSESRGDEPEVSNVAKAAAKLAIGRSAKAGSAARASSGGTSTYTGERRNILAHIAEAFADKATGDFMKISEIRLFTSAEYGDDHPSAGAISARLFPKNGKVSEAVATTGGVKPDEVDGSKGATKL